MDPVIHLAGPAQEAPKFAALAPYKFPEFKKANLLHLDAGVGFNAPEKIGTSPRRQMVTLGCVPEEAELVAHESIITTKGRARTKEVSGKHSQNMGNRMTTQ
jgi:hypothetical protein